MFWVLIRVKSFREDSSPATTTHIHKVSKINQKLSHFIHTQNCESFLCFTVGVSFSVSLSRPKDLNMCNYIFIFSFSIFSLLILNATTDAKGILLFISHWDNTLNNFFAIPKTVSTTRDEGDLEWSNNHERC
jgi:hypothetical protein